MQHGTLDDQVQQTSPTVNRLPLIDKAKWCFQMASAIAHTHFAAHTFHMDIKPANIVVDANRDLILIDWEQSGAWQYSLAPEVDGFWDVETAETISSYCTGLTLVSAKACLRKILRSLSGKPCLGST